MWRLNFNGNLIIVLNVFCAKNFELRKREKNDFIATMLSVNLLYYKKTLDVWSKLRVLWCHRIDEIIFKFDDVNKNIKYMGVKTHSFTKGFVMTDALNSPVFGQIFTKKRRTIRGFWKKYPENLRKFSKFDAFKCNLSYLGITSGKSETWNRYGNLPQFAYWIAECWRSKKFRILGRK